MVKRFSFIVLSLLLMMQSQQVFAASSDAGKIVSEQKHLQTKIPEKLPQEIPQEVERAPLTDTGVKVIIKKIIFSIPQKIVSESELQKIVQYAVGKELGFSGLQAIAQKITVYLREEKNYMFAKAYLPVQDITDGVIEIAVMPGVSANKINVVLNQYTRINKKILERIANDSIGISKAMQIKNIERAILLINDIPGISSQASLEKGNQSGSSQVNINANEGKLINGVVSVDNYGDRYTGTWRRTVQLAVNDPLGWGDQISGVITNANHLLSGKIAYSIPLALSGAFWNISYSSLQYRLGGSMKSLRAKGTAETFATGVSYSLIRTRDMSLWTSLGYESTGLHDETGGSTTSDRRVSVGNFNLNGSFFDQVGKAAITNLTLSLYSGTLEISEIGDAKATDLTGAGSDGDFFRTTYSIARLQRATDDLSFLTGIRGQFAGRNLDSSQKFILGGPTGVRAYPIGEASGDEGHTFTLESRYDLKFTPSWAKTQLVLFYDAGYIKLHKNTWTGSVTNVSGKNHYWLAGAGPGLIVGKDGLYSVRLSYARKISNNPGRNTDNSDADNRHDPGCFWFQGIIWF